VGTSTLGGVIREEVHRRSSRGNALWSGNFEQGSRTARLQLLDSNNGRSRNIGLSADGLRAPDLQGFLFAIDGVYEPNLGVDEHLVQQRVVHDHFLAVHWHDN